MMFQIDAAEQNELESRRFESMLRARAGRMGYRLRKSRRATSLDNQGGFMIFDLNRNWVVDGARFELTLEDVEGLLDEYAKGQLKVWPSSQRPCFQLP